METTWWGFKEVQCPQCERVSFLMEVHFAADGGLRFKYFCTNCKENFNIDYYSSQLQAIATGLDVDKNLTAQPKREKVVRPPLKQLPRVPEKETPDDKKFLHDLGIQDPEEGDSAPTA